MDTHSKADAAAPALAHVLVGTLEIEDVRQLFDRCASSKFTGLLELHEGARKVTVGFVGGEALEGIEPLKLGAVWRKGSWQLSQRALDLSGGLADGVEVQGSLGDASPMDLLELCEDGRLSAEIVFTGGDAGKSATVRFAKGRMEGAELNGKPDMAALATVGGWKGGRFRLTVRPQFAPPESSLNADAPSGAIALPPAAPSPTSGPPRPPIVPALPVAPPAATVAAAPPSPAEDSTGGWDADEDATRESPAAPMAVASPAGVPTVEGTAPTIPAAATPTIAATATATSPSAIASSAASTGLARPSLGATGGVRPSLLGAKPLPSRDAKPGAPVPSLLKVTIGAGKPALAGDAAAGGSAAGPLAGAPSAIKATPAAGVAAPPSAPTSSPAAPSLFARAAGSALKPASTPGAPAGGASLFARAGGAGGPPSAPGSASTKPAMPSLLGRPGAVLPGRPGGLGLKPLGGAPTPASPAPAAAPLPTASLEEADWSDGGGDEPPAAVPPPKPASSLRPPTPVPPSLPGAGTARPATPIPPSATPLSTGRPATPIPASRPGAILSPSPLAATGSRPPAPLLTSAVVEAPRAPSPPPSLESEPLTASAGLENATASLPVAADLATPPPSNDDAASEGSAAPSLDALSVPAEPLAPRAATEEGDEEPTDAPDFGLGDDLDDGARISRSPFATSHPPTSEQSLSALAGDLAASPFDQDSPVATPTPAAPYESSPTTEPADEETVRTPTPTAPMWGPAVTSSQPAEVSFRPSSASASAAAVTRQLDPVVVAKTGFTDLQPQVEEPARDGAPAPARRGALIAGGVFCGLIAVGLGAFLLVPSQRAADAPVVATKPNPVVAPPPAPVVKAPPIVPVAPPPPVVAPAPSDPEARLVAEARKATIEGRKAVALKIFKAAYKLNPKDPAFAIYVPMALGKTGVGKLVLDGKGPITVNGHRFEAPATLSVPAGPYAVDNAGQSDEVIVEKGGTARLVAKVGAPSSPAAMVNPTVKPAPAPDLAPAHKIDNKAVKVKKGKAVAKKGKARGKKRRR